MTEILSLEIFGHLHHYLTDNIPVASELFVPIQKAVNFIKFIPKSM